jgi:heptosyltransferase-2
MVSTTDHYKFFILRNNDLGDVLVSTPLANGLRQAFPNSKISIGTGVWARPLIENNPHIDDIISCNAPWHNKQICNHPANSLKTFFEGLIYVLFSKEARYMTKMQFTHGIDMLGSRQGSWLLRRCRIPKCFGVKGYAGGDKWCNKNVVFKENRNVSESGIKFLSLIDSSIKIEVEPRPVLNLSRREINSAETSWGEKLPETKRLIIAPGGGFPDKCWGDQNYSELAGLLLKNKSYQICIIGAYEDKNRIIIQGDYDVLNLCGHLSLRESAAMVSTSDFIVTNSSLSMHLAGAFKIPSLTLLGDCYDSAELHHKQWGYPEGMILGKEKSKGTSSIASVIKAHTSIQRLLNTQAIKF